MKNNYKKLKQRDDPHPTPSPTTKINPTEKTRTTLAQLRFVCCHLLNSYLSRIDEYIPCGPNCDEAHLLSCPSQPITLATKGLRTNPVEVATFLNLINDDTNEE